MAPKNKKLLLLFQVLLIVSILLQLLLGSAMASRNFERPGKTYQRHRSAWSPPLRPRSDSPWKHGYRRLP